MPIRPMQLPPLMLLGRSLIELLLYEKKYPPGCARGYFFASGRKMKLFSLLLALLGDEDDHGGNHNGSTGADTDDGTGGKAGGLIGSKGAGHFDVVGPVKLDLGVGVVVLVDIHGVGGITDGRRDGDDGVDAVVVVSPGFEVAVALAVLGERGGIVVQREENIIDGVLSIFGVLFLF